jgi:hypothetical protein
MEDTVLQHKPNRGNVAGIEPLIDTSAECPINQDNNGTETTAEHNLTRQQLKRARGKTK